MISYRLLLSVAVVGLLAGCGDSIPTENQLPPATPDYGARVRQATRDLESLVKLHEVVGGYGQGVGGDVACMHDPTQIFCLNKTGEIVGQFQRPDEGQVQIRVWSGGSRPFPGVPVYQPKDQGRMFHVGSDAASFPYWVMYDPQGRDVGQYLTDNGFTNVRVVNSRVAIADPIQDPQKRREFWIWVQAREHWMKEFEKKHPHLAATVASKE